MDQITKAGSIASRRSEPGLAGLCRFLHNCCTPSVPIQRRSGTLHCRPTIASISRRPGPNPCRRDISGMDRPWEFGPWPTWRGRRPPPCSTRAASEQLDPYVPATGRKTEKGNEMQYFEWKSNYRMMVDFIVWGWRNWWKVRTRRRRTGGVLDKESRRRVVWNVAADCFSFSFGLGDEGGAWFLFAFCEVWIQCGQVDGGY